MLVSALLAVLAVIVPAGNAFSFPRALGPGALLRADGSSISLSRHAGPTVGRDGMKPLCMVDQYTDDKELKRRRLQRIAALRREVAADAQRLRDKVREDLRKRGAGTQTLTRLPESNDLKLQSIEAQSLPINASTRALPAKTLPQRGSFSKEEVRQQAMGFKGKARRRRLLDATSADGADASSRPKNQGGFRKLIMERRTSFEMRKMPSTERLNGGDDTAPPRRWGPRQLINGPPGMRLRKSLRKERRERGEGALLGQGQMPSLPSAQSDDTDSSDGKEPTMTLWVCRHTDRYTPEWVNTVGPALAALNASSSYAADIPLSPLGHQQAQELANFLAKQRVTVILSSPYLRTLQVAQKVSHATGAKIWVEPGLCEGPRHVKESLPALEERFRYFPEIDLSYRPCTEEPDGEEDDLAVIPRSAEAATRIVADLKVIEPDGGVAVITHGSVALGLSAALLENLDNVTVTAAAASDQIDAIRSTLDNMDSSRPGGYFKLEWFGEPEPSWGEAEVEEKSGWWGDTSCETSHLTREACDTNSGTRAWDFPTR